MWDEVGKCGKILIEISSKIKINFYIVKPYNIKVIFFPGEEK